MPKMSVAQESEYLSVKFPFNRRDFLSTSFKADAAAFTTGLLPKRNGDSQIGRTVKYENFRERINFLLGNIGTHLPISRCRFTYQCST